MPQLYVKGEFVGGCDIMLSMHQSGELESLLVDKQIVKPEDALGNQQQNNKTAPC